MTDTTAAAKAREIEVTEADREVYATYLRLKNGSDTDEAKIAELMAGEWDQYHGVQIAALARALASEQRVKALEEALGVADS